MFQLYFIRGFFLRLSAAMLICSVVPLHGDAQQPAWRPERIEAPGLPNAYRLHERVLSGGEPAGEVAFAGLQKLGVRTIISVDGAQPQLDLARKYGLRYVHLPHGYDGVPADRGKELAKAVRDLPGPVYIHCHHGKHRSPVAATVACVAAGLLAPEQALAVLTTAGTSEHYRGLYESAKSARKLDDALLDSLHVEFPAAAQIPPMAGAMVQIEHTFDHLKLLAENDFQSLADQPDLSPAHEALLLNEHYRELARTDDARRQPAEFRKLLADAEQVAQRLATSLRQWQAGGSRPPAPAAVRDLWTAATQSCTACHEQFRDQPPGSGP